jgi:non-hemolytic enterotoxin B/C
MNVAATDVITSKLVVDAYASAIIKQPALTLTEVPDLNAHLTKAQVNAATWVESVSSQMVLRITDVIGFGDVWSAFGPRIKQAVEAKNAGEVVSLLTVMRETQVKPLMSNAQASTAQAAQLQVLLAADEANMNADLTLGTSVYAGDEGVIRQLTHDNEDLQVSMSNLMTQIGLASTAIVVGGLMIVVGALAEIPTGGASTAIVVVGVGVTGAGIAGVVLSAKDYDTALNKYRGNLQTIAQDQAEMKVLTAMKGQVSGLAAANQSAQTALATLANSWTAVDGYFKNIIADLGAGLAFPDAVLEELDAANLEWARLTTTATALANNLGVPQVHVDLSQPPTVEVHDTEVAA